MCPRAANGSFVCPESSTCPASWSMYTEGDAEHWRWFVPHDIEGLLSLFSSPSIFQKLLDSFFQEHIAFHETFGAAVPNPYYWAGNEVDMYTPFLFNLVNCTHTQYWSRQILETHFSTNPNGLPGNDDYGAMSAYILFSSVGFFPLAGMPFSQLVLIVLYTF